MPPLPRDTCYFDGHCGFCRRSTRLLQRLDWFHRLAFEDLTTSPSLPVPLESALEGMPMRTRHGSTLIGFPAVRRALRQTPLGFLPALLLYLPLLSHLAAAAYRHIARNRSRSCSVTHP
ncbi:MAG: DUF393 domain-containing protein [Phycisphaeraceae bacterium]|nr:DUF393 domain-containing protein [Phycisphaeraceae bacterium]